jgi:hypothetical protein
MKGVENTHIPDLEDLYDKACNSLEVWNMRGELRDLFGKSGCSAR